MDQNPKSMDTEDAGSAQSGAKPDKRATQNQARTSSRVSSRSASKTVQQTGGKQAHKEERNKEERKQTSKQKSRAKPPNGVREARIERMMSKAELARRAGLSVLTIDRVEKGLESRMDTKRKILEALGLSLPDRVRVFGEEE
jgi:ribosome-binding protein aMBF1 (putative translation factor)